MPKRAICQYWNWHSHFQYWHPFPVLSFFEFHFRKFSIWYSTQTRNLPALELSVTHSSHVRYGALPVPVQSFTGPRTGTGLNARGPISSTGLCQFWYGHFSVPYRNWTLCERSHFRHGALPVPVRSFLGSRTGTGLSFPLRGSASSGTVIHWAPYRN